MHWPHAAFKSSWENTPMTIHLATQICALQWFPGLTIKKLSYWWNNVMLWALVNDRHQLNKPVFIKFLYRLLTNTHMLSHVHTRGVKSSPKLTSSQCWGKVEGISGKGRKRKTEEEEGDKSKVNFSSGPFLNGNVLLSVFRMVEEFPFELLVIVPSPHSPSLISYFSFFSTSSLPHDSHTWTHIFYLHFLKWKTYLHSKKKKLILWLYPYECVLGPR